MKEIARNNEGFIEMLWVIKIGNYLCTCHSTVNLFIVNAHIHTLSFVVVCM